MKALVKKYSKPGLILEEMPIPELGTNDILIKVLKTSICGTDIHIYQWDKWAQNNINTPLIIGHEFMGRVEDIGDGVTHYKKGDFVSGEGHITCGNCRNCRAGMRHLCHRTIGIGIDRSGAFAEYLSLPESNIWPVHKDINIDIASCFDPLGNAVHSALSYSMVAEDVLITGAGPIGCMATAICKMLGARNVVISDSNKFRLQIAEKMGADRTINITNQNIEDCFQELKI